MTPSQLIETFAIGVGTEEGAFQKGSIADRLNNPLCLTHWKDTAGKEYDEQNGFVHFPTMAIGWSAGRAQCRINILKRKLTFREFFAGRGKSGRPDFYRGFDKGGNPVAYAHKLLAFMTRKFALSDAVTIDTPIYSLLEQQ